MKPINLFGTYKNIFKIWRSDSSTNGEKII